MRITVCLSANALAFYSLIWALICLLGPAPSAALVVVNPDGSKNLFNHMTAGFGPAAGTYVASGPFLAAIPVKACQDLQNADQLQGAIVYVQRGSCSFVEKVLAAQKAGASAVVVGDDHESDPAYIQMGAVNEDLADDVSIPAVFLAFSDAILLEESIPLNATLDQDGEVPLSPDSMTPNVQSLAMLLLILPVVWCGGVAIFYLLKLIRERREARQRADRSSHLPVMRYQRLVDQESAEQSQSSASAASLVANGVATCHNESCAICLEDFNSEVSVKVLPCSHGFHSECIDPWIDSRSDLCPICKRSILEPPQSDRAFCLC